MGWMLVPEIVPWLVEVPAVTEYMPVSSPPETLPVRARVEGEGELAASEKLPDSSTVPVRLPPRNISGNPQGTPAMQNAGTAAGMMARPETAPLVVVKTTPTGRPPTTSCQLPLRPPGVWIVVVVEFGNVQPATLSAAARMAKALSFMRRPSSEQNLSSTK